MAPWLMTAGTSATWQFILKLETHGDVRFAKSVGAHQCCLQSHEVIIGSSGDSGVVVRCCAGRGMGKPGRRFVAAKEAVKTLAALEFAIRSCQFWTLDLARQMLQETGPSNAWTRVSKIAYKAG